ncbi:MAG: hypothetical protein IKG56_05600 [Clostridia bacterium]|nr:hypothetical protein [Clostridia bacterium]
MLILENVFYTIYAIIDAIVESFARAFNKAPEVVMALTFSTIALLFALMTCSQTGYKYETEWKEEKTVLQYREANLWEEPMQKGHVGVAKMHETYQTTGHRYYFDDWDDVYGCDYWEEIILEDGSTAWIIGSAF